MWFVGDSAAFAGVREKDCDKAVLRQAKLAIEGLEKVHRATGEGLKQLKSYVTELRKKPLA